eukprot:gene1799-941_t
MKATITVRLIRSFEYRNVMNMVVHDYDTSKTTEEFMEYIMKEIQKESKYLTHRKKNYDTLKLYTQAHSMKSQHLVINFEDDETKLLLKGKTLEEQGIENETELSCFNLEEYITFKKNPEIKW